MNRLRKLLILLVMLVLPIQGWAAVFSPLHRAINAPSASAVPCHQTEHHTTQVGQSSAVEHTGGISHDTDTANHLCCHHVFSCAPTRAIKNTAAHKFSTVSRFVLPLATLFIPDSPDRPPRG